MKLRAGQLWEVHHSQVTLEGVLVSIWGRHESKGLLIRGYSDAVYTPYRDKPVWAFCGFKLTRQEAEELFIHQTTCESARCVFDPWEGV